MRKWHLVQEFDVAYVTTPCQPWSGDNKPGTASADCLITPVLNLAFATRIRFLVLELMPAAAEDAECSDPSPTRMDGRMPSASRA